MSDLSSAYSEYEKVSGLFRQLNEAALVARQTQLGLDPPSPEEQEHIREQLDDALGQLSQAANGGEDVRLAEGVSLGDVWEQDPDEHAPVSRDTVSAIRGRISGGLEHLTDEDLETIERITIALDSASELLFRRIQK
jgi:hypothetical protein